MYSYCAYNLGISSEVELPHLPPGSSRGDVYIRLAGTDPLAGPPPYMDTAYHVTPRLATLDYAGLGRLVVRDGREITIRLLPGADESPLPFCITGTALAILLYQRGLLVLQASAVMIGGKAVVLMAGRGAGKSALAARLCHQGHSLLADDITAIDLQPRQPVVIPATPTLLLDATTVAALGQDPAHLHLLHPATPKFVSKVERGFAQAPVPLSVVYGIQTRRDNNIGHIPLQAGLSAIIRHSYPDCLLQPGGIDHLRQCSRLVGAVAVCELSRRLDTAELPELAQMVEGHVATMARAPGGSSA